jgi:hypothetical protein
MTQQAELFRIVEKLPSQYLGEVIAFAGYLQHKAINGNKPLNIPTEETPKGRPGFGCAKGKYQVTEAFFEPLEDFKDYM